MTISVKAKVDTDLIEQEDYDLGSIIVTGKQIGRAHV